MLPFLRSGTHLLELVIFGTLARSNQGLGESDSRTRVLGSPAVQGYATVAYPPEPYWCIRTVRVQVIRIQDSVFGISVSLRGKLIRFE